MPRTPESSQGDEAAKRTAHDGTDLVPADLDLVIRVDLSRVRDALGEQASRDLIRSAAQRSGADGLAREALASAEVVWLGLRLADAAEGDRVLVIHTARAGKDETALSEPDEIAWEQSDTGVAAVRRYVARQPVPRDGTARVYLVGDRDAVFVSPVEATSVERILRRGPDPRRGQPEARGLMSLDYRAKRLSPELEQRFPALAGLWRGIERIHGQVEVQAEALQLEARVLCEKAEAASKLHRFLETIRQVGLEHARFGPLIAELELEQSGSTLALRWPLPPGIVVSLLASPTTPGQEPPAEPSP